MNRRHFLQTCATIIAGCAIAPKVLLASGWKEAQSLPDLGSFGLAGGLPNLKGKVVYLDFWASWCGPCKASFPVLDQWQKEFAGKRFTVLGVSVDEKESDMRNFLKKTPVSFPVVRDSAHQLVAAADVSSMPTSFLIDRNGIIRHVHHGFRAEDGAPLAAQISALLAEG